MEDIDSSIEEDKYYRHKSERLQRVRIVMAVVPAIFGITALVHGYLSPVPMFETFSGRIISLLTPIFFLVSGLAVLMIYLQTGFRKSTENIDYIKYESELKSLKNRIEHSTDIDSSDLEIIQSEISSLKKQLSNSESLGEVITDETKGEIVEILRAKIVKESFDQASQDVLQKIEGNIKNLNHLKEVEGVFSRTLKRLYSEINALSRRGNLNLSIGILTTIIGLGILGYFVLEIDSIPEDTMAFIAHFIPRLSLVILIEVFAYFFLKLYKSSLAEIKYFQNEMTNVEAKLAAIKCSIMTSDTKSTSGVIQALSATERNAVLEKDQTTAEIEKARIEYQNISTLSEKVSNILGAKKNA